MNDSQKLKAWVFGLRSVLLGVLGVAVLFATYRVGFQYGRSAGPIVPANLSTHEIYPREYDVSDLVKGNDDAHLLQVAIRNTQPRIHGDMSADMQLCVWIWMRAHC